MNMTKSRFTPTKRALIFWTLFIGLGAVFGSYQMLTDPTGKSLQMDAMLPYFQKMPFADVLFRDYIFSGIALLLVNGLPNLLAAGLMIVGKKLGVLLGGIFGVTLMLWICIQFWLFPANPLSISYFLFGFLQAITGIMALIFAKQEDFHVCQADYPRIGTNHKRLVVFFSRIPGEEESRGRGRGRDNRTRSITQAGGAPCKGLRRPLQRASNTNSTINKPLKNN